MKTIPIADIKFKVGNRYIITGWEIGVKGHSSCLLEWKCLEITPKGCVKIEDMISGEKQWLLPKHNVEIYEVIETFEI